MILNIPLISTTSTFEISVTLDGSQYVFRMQWNTRSYKWYFSLLDTDGTILVAGRKLSPDRPLLERDTDERLPPGDLWLLDTEGLGADPGLRDLGKRHRLLYAS